jgi:hypothetical protein
MEQSVLTTTMLLTGGAITAAKKAKYFFSLQKPGHRF